MDVPTPVSCCHTRIASSPVDTLSTPPLPTALGDDGPMTLLEEPTYAIVNGRIVITLSVMDAHALVQNSEPTTLQLDFKKMGLTNPLPDTGQEITAPGLSDGHTPLAGDRELQDEVLIERDDTYYLSMILFEIKDHQFLVPRWRFSESTTHFDLVLSQDRAEDSVITLDSVSPDDFRGLMRGMYPLTTCDTIQGKLSKQEWITTLKLATQWKMLQYRRMALAYLQIFLPWDSTLTAIEDVVLGMTCGVPSWYRRGCIEFVEGGVELESHHKDTLGIETMVKLMRARDDAYNPDLHSYHQRFSTRSHPYHNILPKLFEAEAAQALSDMDPVERILVARNYGLSDWLLFCYHQLVKREDSITVKEVEVLGLETAIKLWKARLELFRTYRRILEQVDLDRPGPDFSGAVEKEFRDEFAETQLMHDWLDSPPPISTEVELPPPAEIPTSAGGGMKKKKKKGGVISLAPS